MSWAQAGAAGIIITGRAVKDLEAVAAELRETSPKTDVVALTADVTSEDAIVELYSKSKARFGIIDVLICNAGVFNGGEMDFPVIGTFDPKRWWFDLVHHSAVSTAWLRCCSHLGKSADVQFGRLGSQRQRSIPHDPPLHQAI